MSRIAYVNGRYRPHRDALVHIEDRGYQFADGVYEVCEVSAGRLVDERRHMERLQRSLQASAPMVQNIESTAARWRTLQWAVDPHLYPVELLNQVASLLPPEGMRLTGFEMQKGKVTIRGEASTAPAAFKFAEDVKSKPELQMFTWQMPSPSLRPDGRAEFTIEGDPKIAKIN